MENVFIRADTCLELVGALSLMIDWNLEKIHCELVVELVFHRAMMADLILLVGEYTYPFERTDSHFIYSAFHYQAHFNCQEASDSHLWSGECLFAAKHSFSRS